MTTKEKMVSRLSSTMVTAILYIWEHPKVNCTCARVGVMLTERKSSYGHQTSAWEGGRTLTALRRRGLVFDIVTDDGLRSWHLTADGLTIAEAIPRAERRTLC